MMRTIVQIGAVLALTAVLAAVFPYRLLSFTPVTLRPVTAFASFATVDASTYGALVRHVRTSWQVESRKRYAGMTAPDFGLSVLADDDPPPEGLSLPASFASGAAVPSRVPSLPGAVHTGFMPPSVAAGEETFSGAAVVKPAADAVCVPAIPRAELLALPPALIKSLENY